MIALEWQRSEQSAALSLLDQSKYPLETTWNICLNVESVARVLSSGQIMDEKIAALAGAYGYALAALDNQDKQLTPAFDEALAQAKELLLASRDHSRDMKAAMDFMENPPEAYTKNVDRLTTILATAVTFNRQQVVADRNICRNGTDLMGEGTRLLIRTDRGAFHSASPCGALGIARRGMKRGVLESLALCEGRPSQLGGTLLAQELSKEEIPCTVLPDHAAATFLARQGAHLVLTDGILAAKNGDLKAPVGTYELAIACYFHSIPFYAVLDANDIDLDLDSGAAFGQEEGDPASVTASLDCGSAQGWTPAYDVIPSFLITGMITDRGIACAPYDETLDELVKHAPKKMIVNFDS
jgi:methylthioribose-1-phosphate isomerase